MPIKPKQMSEAEKIYHAYPKRVGKKKAIPIIQRALKELDNEHESAFVWLLGRTRLYAAARFGQEVQFTPYPSTWYGQGRYDDDAELWKQGVTRNGPERPDLTSEKRYENVEHWKPGNA